MTKKTILILIFNLLIFTNFINAQKTHFQLIVLGNGESASESNHSAYLLGNGIKNDFICLDAGVIIEGINKSIKKKNFGNTKLFKNQPISPEYYILRNYIKAYLITYPGIDKIAGLTATEQYDTNKYVYATHNTIESLLQHVFNGKIFADYSAQGKNRKYRFVPVNQGNKISIDNTSFNVESFYLSHYGNQSTAYLIENAGFYFLYLGNTGSDISEGTNNLENLWRYIAPIIRERKLKAILIECSFTNETDKDQLFGHLNTKLLSSELEKLEEIVNFKQNTNYIKGLNVIITQIKPSTQKNIDNKKLVKNQLLIKNTGGYNFIFPEQGDNIKF